MSTAIITKLLETTLNSNWVTTPIAWVNVEARDQAISTAPLLSDGDKDYITFSVDITKTEATEIPVGLVRYHGYIGIEVNVKEGVGTRGAQVLIDLLNALFHYQLITDGTNCLRTHAYIDAGTFKMVEGWMTHIIQYPFSGEFSR